MKDNIIEFPSSFFNYNRRMTTLTSEASDMENRHLQPLDDSRTKYGFAVVSEKTKAVILYYMTQVIKNSESEVIGWAYKPTPESVGLFPKCAGTKAIVFND
jgi:hypothetical protein